MCPDTSELSAYFDKELSPSRCEALEHHLKDCPACRAVLELFESQHRYLRHSDVPVLQESGRLENFWGYAARVRMQRLRKPAEVSVPLPLAAAAVLVLAAAVLLNFLPLGRGRFPEVVVVETSRPAPSVVSLTIPPEELEKLLTALETGQLAGKDNIPVLPAELPFVRLGEPQIGRYAIQENQP